MSEPDRPAVDLMAYATAFMQSLKLVERLCRLPLEELHVWQLEIQRENPPDPQIGPTPAIVKLQKGITITAALLDARRALVTLEPELAKIKPVWPGSSTTSSPPQP